LILYHNESCGRERERGEREGERERGERERENLKGTSDGVTWEREHQMNVIS
jgi:hypothetical protein